MIGEATEVYLPKIPGIDTVRINNEDIALRIISLQAKLTALTHSQTYSKQKALEWNAVTNMNVVRGGDLTSSSSSGDLVNTCWFFVRGYTCAIDVQTIYQLADTYGAEGVHYLPKDGGFVFKFTDKKHIKPLIETSLTVHEQYNVLASSLKSNQSSNCNRALTFKERKRIQTAAAMLCARFACDGTLEWTYLSGVTQIDKEDKEQRIIHVRFSNLPDAIDCYMLSGEGFADSMFLDCANKGIKCIFKSSVPKRKRDDDIDEDEEFQRMKQTLKNAKK